MPWARVDDSFWCHPKVLDLPLAARGLWVSVLSWSCQQKTDAVHPQIVAMCGGTVELAGHLVDAGLWLREGSNYRIHDWDEYQSERAKKVAAGRMGGIKSGQVRGHNEADEGASGEAEYDASSEAGPSRPDPTRPQQQESPSSADADGDSFDRFWEACPRKVGKSDARRKFTRAGVDPAVLVAAMRTHAERWAADGTDPRFIPHPATWLHQGRWADELVAQDTGPPEFRPSPVLARNARRASGEACPECADVGYVEDGPEAFPCPSCHREAVG